MEYLKLIDYKIDKYEKNTLYRLENTEIDNIYNLYYDNDLFHRMVKLEKILNRKIKHLGLLREYLKYEISTQTYMERILSNQLAKSIDREIINTLRDLGNETKL